MSYMASVKLEGAGPPVAMLYLRSATSVSEASRHTARHTCTLRRDVLDSEVFSGAAGVVAGSQDKPTNRNATLAVSDDGGDSGR